MVIEIGGSTAAIFVLIALARASEARQFQEKVTAFMEASTPPTPPRWSPEEIQALEEAGKRAAEEEARTAEYRALRQQTLARAPGRHRERQTARLVCALLCLVTGRKPPDAAAQARWYRRYVFRCDP